MAMTGSAVGEPGAVPAADLHEAQRPTRYFRAAVLGSRGDGSARRRASDAVRLGLGVLTTAVATVLVQANTGAELSLQRFLTPPPDGIRWLVATVWLAGFLCIVAVPVFAAIAARDTALARDSAAVVLLGWLACVAAGMLAGPTGGRSAAEVPDGTSPGYPSVRIAVAAALVIVAYPYLSRPLRRLALAMAGLMAAAAMVHGAALPLTAVASAAIGYTATMGVRLIFGRPDSLPSVTDVSDALAELAVTARDVAAAPEQAWGVAAFTARDATDRPLEISVYGRDAADAQFLAKAWRALVYRDSGTSVELTRLQQVEHDAYLTLRAGLAGVRVPDLLAAGPGGPNRDALLVTRTPAGTPLSRLDEAMIPEAAIEDLFTALGRLRTARLSHGAISGATIIVDDTGQVALRDFRYASSGAPPSRIGADAASALATLALTVGIDRAATAAARYLDTDALRAALLHVQPAALATATAGNARRRKGFLDELRRKTAEMAGIEVSELAKMQRVTWGSVLLALGTGIGMWAMLGVLANVGASVDTLRGATWGWVVLVFILSLLPPVVMAWSLVASLFRGVPLLQATLLQETQSFTGLVGSAVASMAVTTRFFQRRGQDFAFATSTSLLASTVNWIVKGLLFAVCIPLAWGNFHFDVPSGNGSANLVNLLLFIVIIVGVLLGLALALPTVRHLAWSKIRPFLVGASEPVKSLAAEPGKLAALLAGNTGAQLLTALALGAALHAFHHQMGLASLLVVITVASALGGASPVPGGLGVIEAGMIAGFIAAGIPQEVAVSTVFVQRLFTSYLPPIWGWLSLVWLRRKELI